MTDAAPAESTELPGLAWSFSRRVAFRVAFIYATFFSFDSGLFDSLFWMLPWAQRGFGWLHGQLELGACWVGASFFGLTGEAVTPHPTGSGDTAKQYLITLCSLLIAGGGGLVWTLISESRRNPRRQYRTLYAWLHLGLRFTLGGVLLSYGFAKIWPSQFPPPSLLTLTGTYGDSSPMRLLWTFMGASPPYTIFGGIAEIVPGLLLLFRRTGTVGALLAAGVLLNVVLLNFCYDVPVKLFSTQLFLAAAFLAAPNAVVLWQFFFLGRAVTLAESPLPRWKRRVFRYTAYALQVVTIVGFFYQTGVEEYLNWRKQPTGRPSIYGVWAMDKVEGVAAGAAWEKIVFERLDQVRVLQPAHPQGRFDAVYHDDTRVIDIATKPEASTLQWARPGEHTLVLTGTWEGTAVTANLHRVDSGAFQLQTRGFHWIQEYPYNR